jgi:hypothetical protein
MRPLFAQLRLIEQFPDIFALKKHNREWPLRAKNGQRAA